MESEIIQYLNELKGTEKEWIIFEIATYIALRKRYGVVEVQKDSFDFYIPKEKLYVDAKLRNYNLKSQENVMAKKAKTHSFAIATTNPIDKKCFNLSWRDFVLEYEIYLYEIDVFEYFIDRCGKSPDEILRLGMLLERVAEEILEREVLEGS